MTIIPLEWTPAIAVGVEEIDAQHRELYAQINTLMLAMHEGRAAAELAAAFEFLERYVAEHFAMEEGLMRLHQYPRWGTHTSEHERFMGDLLDYRRTFEQQGPSVRLAMQLHAALGAWLVTHIRGTDRQLGVFLAQRSELTPPA